jgi:hypothetical protein
MLKLRAAASLHEILGETPTDLRARLKQMTGQNFRRINRFIELALIGAFRCRDAAGGIAPDTALYLACDSPMLADSVKILRGIQDERRPPSPFEFMNISGNMAGYYVATQLGLNGPQLALHRNRAGLEATLELLALQSAPHRRVLVGYVEEGVWPLTEQRARLDHWPADRALAECSHWLYFDEDSDAPPLATIERCRTYASADDARNDLSGLAGNTRLSLGSGISIAEASRWRSALQLPSLFSAVSDGAYTTGLTALAVTRFVEQGISGRLLHLNRLDGGAYAATLVRV